MDDAGYESIVKPLLNNNQKRIIQNLKDELDMPNYSQTNWDNFTNVINEIQHLNREVEDRIAWTEQDLLNNEIVSEFLEDLILDVNELQNIFEEYKSYFQTSPIEKISLHTANRPRDRSVGVTISIKITEDKLTKNDRDILEKIENKLDQCVEEINQKLNEIKRKPSKNYTKHKFFQNDSDRLELEYEIYLDKN